MTRPATIHRAASVLAVPFSIWLTACDQHQTGTFAVGSTSAPSPLLSAQILPQTLSLIPVKGFSCPVTPPFTTGFDLVITPQSRVDTLLNQVSFNFLNGSSISGSPLFFAVDDLARLFGSTLIPAGASRAFTFRPTFGCGSLRTTSMTARIVLVDATGASREVTLSAPVR
jgi:hypothetical protein